MGTTNVRYFLDNPVNDGTKLKLRIGRVYWEGHIFHISSRLKIIEKNSKKSFFNFFEILTHFYVSHSR